MSRTKRSIIGRILTELRRSNAAGKHGKTRKQTRGEKRRDAIKHSADDQ